MAAYISWFFCVIGIFLTCCDVSLGLFYVGSEVKDRKELDLWSNAVYIPEPTKTVSHGNVLHWKFYARRAVPIYLQLWRPVGGASHKTTRFLLVGQEYFEVKKTGVNIVSATKSIVAQDGDVAGFLFPRQSLIPFDANSCQSSGHGGLYIRSPRSSGLVEGQVYAFSRMLSSWRPCRTYSLEVAIGPDGAIEVGRQTIDRSYLDEWSNAILIPEPHQQLKEGTMLGWRIYARRTGTVYLQVWRPTGSSSEYELVGQIKFIVRNTGAQTLLHRGEFLDVKTGDVIGFYYPGQSVIPFDGRECYDQRGLYVRNPPSSKVVIGAKFRFDIKQTGWNPCRKYSITSIMIQGTWTGHEAKAREEMDEWSFAMYIPNPNQPITESGNIYGWHFYSLVKNPIAFQVYRPQIGVNRYRLVAQTHVIMTDGKGVQHLGVHSVKVQKGDVLGFYFPKGSVVPFTGRECFTLGARSLYVKSTKPVIGKDYTFSRKLSGWKPCRKYSFGALFATGTSSAKRSLDENNDVEEEKVQEDLLLKLMSSMVGK